MFFVYPAIWAPSPTCLFACLSRLQPVMPSRWANPIDSFCLLSGHQNHFPTVHHASNEVVKEL